MNVQVGSIVSYRSLGIGTFDAMVISIRPGWSLDLEVFLPGGTVPLTKIARDNCGCIKGTWAPK